MGNQLYKKLFKKNYGILILLLVSIISYNFSITIGVILTCLTIWVINYRDLESQLRNLNNKYYKNGQVRYDREMLHSYRGKHSVTHIRVKSWYENGQLKSKEELYNEKRHNFLIEYYENGKLKSKREYKFGELLSKKNWSKNGKEIIEDKFYQLEKEGDIKVEGVESVMSKDLVNIHVPKLKRKILHHKSDTFNPFTGIEIDIIDNHKIEIEVINGVKNGFVKTYYENGQLKFEGQQFEGVTNGPSKSYYKNGKLETEGSYKENKKDGYWKWYNKENTLGEEGNYINDQRDGPWKYYYDNGQLKSDMIYRSGQLDGVFRKYYENGQLEGEGNIKEGIIEGIQKRYYNNGQLGDETNYKNDKLISKKCWDEDGNETECE